MFGNKQVEIDMAEDHRRAALNAMSRINRLYETKCIDFDKLKNSHDSLESELKARITENEDLKFQLNPPESKIYEILYHDGAKQIIKAHRLEDTGIEIFFLNSISPRVTTTVGRISRVDYRSIVEK